MNKFWSKHKHKSMEFWEGAKAGIDAYAVSLNGERKVGSMKRKMSEVFAEIDAVAAGLTEGEIPIDQIDGYTMAYRKTQELDAKLKVAKKQLNIAKEMLIEYLDGLGLSSVKRGDVNIIRSRRTYTSVEDYDALMDWVRKQEEPETLYIERTFIKGKPKDERGMYLMVQDAQKESVETGMPVEQCYPDGLKVYVGDVVTVRRSRKESTGKPIPQSQVEKLEKEMEGF